MKKLGKDQTHLFEEQMTVFIYDLSSNWSDDCSIA